jgi:Zn-dependent protease
MFGFNFSQEFILEQLARLPVIFFALTVHEFAHAWAAVKSGDPTPEVQGRLTLNPLAHLDPIGTLMILFGPIGWGRPVQVNPANFRSPRRDEIFVSAAGPISNIIQAVIFGILSPLIAFLGAYLNQSGDVMFVFLRNVCFYGMLINLALAFFNMIPLFPLDGEKVLLNSLPYRSARKMMAFRQKGPMVLFGLILLGVFTDGRINPIMWILYVFLYPSLVVLDWMGNTLIAVLSNFL